MSTHLIDLVNSAQVTWTYQGTISSDTTTDSTAVDCSLLEGPVHAVVAVGAYGDLVTATSISFIECATEAGTYSAVTDSGTLSLTASATANDNTAHFLKCDKRSMKFLKLRIVTTGGGTVSVALAAAIFGRKKISGAGTGTQTT